MEIIPGVGVEAVKIGDPRGEVEQRLGPPVHAGNHTRCVHDSIDPMLVVTYGQDDLVELVEVGYGVDDQVFFDGVQLTYRFMDDVMADLAAKGHPGTRSDIGFDPGRRDLLGEPWETPLADSVPVGNVKLYFSRTEIVVRQGIVQGKWLSTALRLPGSVCC